MKTETKLAFWVIMGAVLVPINATADTATLYPTDDAVVVEGYPATNYGNDAYLTVGYSSIFVWANTLIKFDLSSYSGATVNSAYIRLYVYDSVGSFPTVIIRIARNNADWVEGSVTWNNKPVIGESTPITAPSTYDWWVIDVTGWIQDIVSGADPNYGFQIYKNSSALPGTFTMHSKEYSSNHPELVLDYTPSALVNTSWGLIKAGF